MTELGDWVVGDAIGHGAGTVVHRGHHRLHPDRVVAIKRVRGATVPLDRDVVATIEREAQVLRRLDHSAIMPFSDVVADGDGLAVVMPLATGGSLAARIQAQGALPWRDVADIGARVASALAAAHGAGVVHRDVTPSNILFGRELEPRLADFGAALLGDDDQRVVGTAGYLDPMVSQGSAPGPGSDVYGLGVVLYEALAGQPPFAGATPQAVMRAADRGIHLPLAALAPDAPGNLCAIIEQAMQRDAAGRFPSAQQLQVALEHVALTASDPAGDATTVVPLPPPPWAATATSDPAGDVDGQGGGGAAGGAAGALGSATAGAAGAAAMQAGHGGVPGDAGSRDDDLTDPDATLVMPPTRDVGRGGTAAMGGPGGLTGLSAAAMGDATRDVGPVPPTTDFGPRPMAPLQIEEPRRPWWMVALLVAVVVIPLGVAAWALLSNDDGTAEPVATPSAVATPSVATTATTAPSSAATPATSSPPAATPTPAPSSPPATSPTPTPTPAPTPTPTVIAMVPRSPAALCDDVAAPTADQLVGDVDGRGCSLPVTVTPGPDVTTVTLPPQAGPLAGDYTLDGPPVAVVLGDWDGDGIDTPAVTLDAQGVVFAFPSWGAGQAAPIDEPIGTSSPVVMTDADGIDHVVAGEGA